MSEAINIYLLVCECAVPIAIAFSIGNLIVSTILNMAFKGRIRFD